MQTKIHKNTFKGCKSLDTVVLPDGVLSIDEGAFQDCTSLQSITMGEDVNFIGTSAFCGDNVLQNVDRFADTNSSHTFDIVGDYAFADTKLTNINLALRSSSIYTFWGDGCFQDCKSLTNVHILSANYLSKNMFKGCTALKKVSYDVNLMAYTYPGVFEGCTSLTSMQLPSQLLFISEEMFKDCTNLRSLTFNNYDADKSGVVLMQKNAFYNANKCTTIHLPASIDTLDQIEDAALSNSNVVDLHLHGIDKDECGFDKQLPEDVYYGIPYTVTTVEKMKKIIELRSLYKVPIVVLTEYRFSYSPNVCNGDMDQIVYLSKMNATQYETKIEEDVGVLTAFNNLNSIDISKVVYNNTTYDFKERKGIIVKAICNLGSVANGADTPRLLFERYRQDSKTHYKNKEFEYNLLTYLRSINLNKELFGSQSNVVFDLVAATNKTAKLNSFSGSRYTINQVQSRGVDYLLYRLLIHSSSGYWNVCSTLKAQTKIDVQNVTLNDTLKSNKIFRSKFSSGYVTLHCKDGDLKCLTNTTKETPYVAPVEYTSNKTTINNFRTGAWYYNARELYSYARSKNMPVLFIYSLLGCGPCQIYSKNIWNNSAFQSWATQQKFLLCGLEVTKQPFYDKQLSFMVNELSPNAKNFAKRDQGQSFDTTPTNAFDEKFYRMKNEKGEESSNLMTPVIVFMDKDGNCWDYTYHNISKHIASVGVDGVIQCLKSLCLYHFDNNNISNPTYVVNAIQAFNKYDYIQLDPENPWKVASNLIDLGKSKITTVTNAVDDMIAQLKEVGQDHGGLYLGGCLVSDIDWLYATFGYSLEEATTAAQMNAKFQLWYIRIGGKYYQLQANQSDKKQIDNPCGMGKVNIFKTSFVEKTYPG